MKTLYDKIKGMAEAKGMPIYMVEKEAGLGNGVIAGWKTASPKVWGVAAVAKVLNVTLDDLVEDTYAVPKA